MKPTLQKLFQRLALIAPTDKPVLIRVVRLRGMYGDCELRKGCYRIRIDSRLSGVVLEDTLMHEWAHARSWWEQIEHGPAWGAEYARLLTEWRD